VLPPEQFKTAYYLRLNAEDKPGVLADVTRILAQHHISIDSIIQLKPQDDCALVPVILLTQITNEKEMNAAIAEMEALSSVNGQINRIRLETLG
jgi:homoserine dehydrogenase